MTEGGKKEVACPKCGKKMTLIAAGYYCMKDDYLIDPITGNPPIRPDYVAYLVGDRRPVEVFLEGNRLSIIDRASSKSLWDISVDDVIELELGRIGSDAAHLAAIAIFGIVGASATAPVSTLRIAFLSKTGLKTNISIATDMAKELAERIESLREKKE